tara:strand:+ start:112 stop:234 length:123 start_codon:yes stop_codon:yes gene_type:complete
MNLSWGDFWLVVIIAVEYIEGNIMITEAKTINAFFKTLDS